MGATTTGPRVNFPNTCAGRGAVKVTMASACTMASPPCGFMSSESAPDGISTAITGVPPRLMSGNCIGVEAGHRRAKAGAENRIHQQIAVGQAARRFGFELVCAGDFDGAQRQPLEHDQRVAFQFRSRRQQQDFHNAPGAMQLARDDEPIAAIVAFAADHGDAIGGRVVLQDEMRYRAACVFHQRQGRHSEAFGGGTIDLAASPRRS